MHLKPLRRLILHSNLSPLYLKSLKRDATKLKKELDINHTQALNSIAITHGFSNWSQLQKTATLANSETKIMEWFLSEHSPTQDRYYQPIVSVFHVLNQKFPQMGQSLLSKISAQLNKKSFWASNKVAALISAEQPPMRKKRIQSQYAPSLILGTSQEKSELVIFVPVIRIKREEFSTSPGTLIYRCPICGNIHGHGACEEQLGAGDGHRLSHCDFRSSNDYSFSLVEMTSTTLLGNLRANDLKKLAIPGQ